MIVITVDNDIARLHVGSIERNNAVTRVLDERIDIDDAPAELVCEEGVVVGANLRDGFDTAILTVVHALPHVVLRGSENVCSRLARLPFWRGNLRRADICIAEADRCKLRVRLRLLCADSVIDSLRLSVLRLPISKMASNSHRAHEWCCTGDTHLSRIKLGIRPREWVEYLVCCVR